jgi:hypothetical protein
MSLPKNLPIPGFNIFPPENDGHNFQIRMENPTQHIINMLLQKPPEIYEFEVRFLFSMLLINFCFIK